MERKGEETVENKNSRWKFSRPCLFVELGRLNLRGLEGGDRTMETTSEVTPCKGSDAYFVRQVGKARLKRARGWR